MGKAGRATYTSNSDRRIRPQPQALRHGVQMGDVPQRGDAERRQGAADDEDRPDRVGGEVLGSVDGPLFVRRTSPVGTGGAPRARLHGGIRRWEGSVMGGCGFGHFGLVQYWVVRARVFSSSTRCATWVKIR